MITLDSGPRVWVGCLSCYNSGRLTGDWLDVDGLEEFTVDTICNRPDHEEFQVMDHEGIPISGECSVDEALELCRAVILVAEQSESAGVPLDASLEFISDSNLTDPSLWPDIEDAYRGTAESKQDYVCDYLDESGITLPSWVHVNYDHSFDELVVDLTVIRHEGSYYLFSV